MTILDESFDKQLDCRVAVGAPYQDSFVLDTDENGNPAWIGQFIMRGTTSFYDGRYYKDLGTAPRHKLSNSRWANPDYRRMYRSGWELPTLTQMKEWFGPYRYNPQYAWRVNRLTEYLDSIDARFPQRIWCKTSMLRNRNGQMQRYSIEYLFSDLYQNNKMNDSDNTPAENYVPWGSKHFGYILLVKKI